MPRLSRSMTAYSKLPKSLKTRNLDKCRLQVSVSVTVPTGMESDANLFIKQANKHLEKAFSKFMKDCYDEHEEVELMCGDD